MTKEEAIELVKSAFDVWEDKYSVGNDMNREHKARDMAIKALEQEPCEDCISRKEAIQALKESAEHHANDSREKALLLRDRDIIRALKPPTPQPQKLCEDCISRQSAIKAMLKIEHDDIEKYGCSIPEGFDSRPAIDALNNLPSVTPEQKKEVIT